MNWSFNKKNLYANDIKECEPSPTNQRPLPSLETPKARFWFHRNPKTAQNTTRYPIQICKEYLCREYLNLFAGRMSCKAYISSIVDRNRATNYVPAVMPRKTRNKLQMQLVQGI
jgi:hypothetical protein